MHRLYEIRINADPVGIQMKPGSDNNNLSDAEVNGWGSWSNLNNRWAEEHSVVSVVSGSAGDVRVGDENVDLASNGLVWDGSADGCACVARSVCFKTIS